MKRFTKQKIAKEMLSWCSDCRLHAAKVVIWHADAEEVKELIQCAFRALPTDMSDESLIDEIAKLCNQLSHEQLGAVWARLDVVNEDQVRCMGIRGRK